MRTLGIDPGSRNLGIGIFDGRCIIMGRVDLAVEHHGEEGFVKVTLNESKYVEAIKLFVRTNYEILATVERVAIEKQMSHEMISLSLAILAYFKGMFPHMDVMIVNPISTRTFFNTRVLHECLSDEVAYRCRKQLSVQVLGNIFDEETLCNIKAKFGDKIDDAAEACLLAIYTFYLVRRQKENTSKGHHVVRMCADINFTSRDVLPLTAEQRAPIVKPHIAASTTLAISKKRKRSAR